MNLISPSGSCTAASQPICIFATFEDAYKEYEKRLKARV
jgi:hypothetical protein